MNPFKSPHQLLLEEAGASLDPSPGLINTPQQMLMQQANVLPHFALGGQVQNLSPADMQATMIVNGHTPQNFATGGQSIAGMYNQSVANKAAYDKEQADKARATEEAYQNQPPVFQAIPDQDTYSIKARNAFAKKLADLTGSERWSEDTTNKIFGGGASEPLTMSNIVPKAVHTAVQFMNPISTVTGVMDAPKEIATQAKEGDYLGAGLTAGFTGLTALPYFKPAKKLINKFKK
jgi:hypothetical protein